jgi:hypothetical protein
MGQRQPGRRPVVRPYWSLAVTLVPTPSLQPTSRQTASLRTRSLAGAVTTAKLDAGAVTADKIAANAITADKILAGTITSDHINATVGLDAAVIKFGSMSGGRIAANSLDVGSISSGTLTAANITINGGSFIIGNPGTGAGQTGILINSQGFRQYLNGVLKSVWDVTGSATFAGALAAATGTFSGALVAASGTFTGDITAGSNLPPSMYTNNNVRNGTMEDVKADGSMMNWSGPVGATGTGFLVRPVVGTGALGGNSSLQLVAPTNTAGGATESDSIPVVAGERWDLRADFKYTGRVQRAYFRALFYNQAGTLLSTVPDVSVNAQVLSLAGSMVTNNPGSATGAGFVDVMSAWAGAALNTTYRTVGQVTVPAGAFFMRLRLFNWSGTTAATTPDSVMTWDNVSATRAIDGVVFNNSVISGGTIVGATLTTAGDLQRILMTPGNLFLNDPVGMASGLPQLPILAFYPSINKTLPTPRISGFEETLGGRNHDSLSLRGGAVYAPGENNPPEENEIRLYPRNTQQENVTSGPNAAGMRFYINAGDGTSWSQTTLTAFIFPSAIGTIDPTTVLGCYEQNIALQFGSGELRVGGYYGTYKPIRASSFPVGSSSRATKKNIQALPFDPIKVITNARPQWWQRKPEFGGRPDEWFAGPMVDDLPEALRSYPETLPETNVDPIEHTGYDLVTINGILWGAVGILANRVAALEAKVV